MRLKTIVATLMLALLAGQGWTSTQPVDPSITASSIHSIKVHTNMTSAAISAWVKDDADTNSTLQIFYRRNSGTVPYDSGMVMCRKPGRLREDTTSPSYWGTGYEGRILHLAAGRRYQYYLKLSEMTSTGMHYITTDPDTFSTISIPTLTIDGGQRFGAVNPETFEEQDNPSGGGLPPPVTQIGGTLIYVRQNGGNDENAGSSWVSAVKTLGRAVELAGLGDGTSSILIYPGHYHEYLNLTWPCDTLTRYVIGMAQKPDSVIICGANALYEQGQLTETQRIAWKETSNYIWCAYFPDSVMKQVVIGGERLPRKTSFTDLNSSEHGYHGWFWHNDSLFVRLTNKTTPAGRKMYAGARPYGINVATKHWRITNLTIQYPGYDTTIPKSSFSTADLTYKGWGISMGVSGDASDVTIDNCRIIGTGSRPIYADRWFRQNRQEGEPLFYACDSVTVVKTFIDGMWTDGYAAGKSRDGEDVSIYLDGMRTIFNYNVLRRMFNGVQPTNESYDWWAADSTRASWSEVCYNKFNLICDDAIELDSYQVINRLIAYNTIDSCGRAISFSPMITNGPAFVFYNRITNTSHGWKLGGGTCAPLVAYHNTIIGGGPIYNPGGEVYNITSRNNIYWGKNTDYVIDIGDNYASWQSGSWNYDVFDSTHVTGMARFTAGGTPNQALSLKRVQYFIPQFETNGKQGNIGIQSELRGDYRLRWPSNAIDTGCRIPGVNTTDRGPMYFIKPDMGCYEFVPAGRRSP